MKILDLEIENIRGIRNKIHLTPNCENLVIYGPNGTGKSAVVDAIEFLFTGDMSRLAGRGTRGISVKSHGPHIDTKAKDALVRASVKFDGIAEPFLLERKMSEPKELICPDIEDEIFHQSLDIAKKGQHVLSRSEILKYVAAEAGKRAEEIQIILNLTKVEEIRKTLGTIKRDADRAVQTDKGKYETSVASLKTTSCIEEFSENALLRKVNECRATLKGQAAKALDTDKLKEGISPQVKDEKERVNREALERALAVANKLIQEKGSDIFDKEKELRGIVKKLKDDEKLKRDLASKRLLNLGISLIDESGSCPICLTGWKPGELEKFLKERVSKAKEAEEVEKNIHKFATEIDTEVSILKGHITNIADASGKLKQETIKKDLEEWSQKLTTWSENLKEAVEDYTTDEVDDEIKVFMADKKWGEHLKQLEKTAEGLEKLTPEQEAWDTLTALTAVLKRYFDEKKEYQGSIKFAERATAASKTYTETKDRFLENLYNSVNEDFTTYYKFLHGADEDGFYAELKPEGAQLDFKVDFYGRGTYHPRALHSEGHQDSMGLCLYLALNKKISEGKVKLVILDDVVMSIDSDHRRNVCKLLKELFTDQQFIITTHNRTWARQLNTDGVIKSKNMVEFRGWSVDAGPIYAENGEVWDDIREKLENNDVASAAHQLREHAEFFYDSVCSSLLAEVRYKGDDRQDLGDFLKGAKKAYKEYLRLAKNAANSWGKQEGVEEYKKIESQANEIIQRTQMEQWGINENVHYSRWADFTKDDFLPIVEAFQDFEGVFRCSKCGGIISLNLKGMTPSNVKCPCGNVLWNLESKN